MLGHISSHPGPHAARGPQVGHPWVQVDLAGIPQPLLFPDTIFPFVNAGPLLLPSGLLIIPSFVAWVLKVYMRSVSSGNPTHLHLVTDNSFSWSLSLLSVLHFLNCFVLFLPLSNCKLIEERKLKYLGISRTPSTGFIRPSESELMGFMVKITDLWKFYPGLTYWIKILVLLYSKI